ncbi:MAG: hypothetical protein KKD18_01120 [Nanoarchaeota archaeon]|nr:hypothetical protein [Nanoarchaeota archaeon]MBU0976996.1 hypothetical protein [Nanoarchaeota archaeon]
MVSLIKKYNPTVKEVYQPKCPISETLSLLEQRVRPTDKDTLIRQGVLGQVDSRTGEGVYAAGLPGSWSPGIQQHEIAHSVLGFDGSPNGEYNADKWMLYKVGKPEQVRGPFYRPPLN